MAKTFESQVSMAPTHPWLRPLSVVFMQGDSTPVLNEVVSKLSQRFTAMGHEVREVPEEGTDALFTTAPFDQPISWRESLMLTARKRFNLQNAPELFTIVQIDPEQFDRCLKDLSEALNREPINPGEFQFDGLAPDSYAVLVEQGRRGGPILTLERVVQAQSKSIKVLLVVGEDRPLWAHYFDLVGAHPRIELDGYDAGYDEIVLRIATVLSTHEVTQHEVVGSPIPKSTWEELNAPKDMCAAAKELGKRKFFTQMVRIDDLVQIPAVSEGIASQYSEGCFATYEPEIEGLIATVTGSARPVEKDDINEDDLAVIVGVRRDGQGALVREVEGKSNDPPSSEAVELMDMDENLPRIELSEVWGFPGPVPVVRSKLHGHRGIASFNPQVAEHVPLDPPYYHFPVSCATEAQARGIKAAFSRSQALQNPEDPRFLAFTVLPGHGVVIAERWVEGKDPFQAIWEAMDRGDLKVDRYVPQGPMGYEPGADGHLHLVLDPR